MRTTIIIYMLLSMAPPLVGQEQRSFEALLLPWIAPQMDAEIRGALQADMKAVHDNLRQELLQAPQMLSAFAKANNKSLSLNQERAASRLWVGKAKLSSPSPKGLVIMPLFCQSQDQFIFGLSFGEARSGLLLSGGYRALAKGQVTEVLVAERFGALLQKTMAGALADARRSLEARRKPKDSALKVGLSLARNSARQDEGSHLCLNHFLALSLASSFHTYQSLGYQEHRQALAFLGIELENMRATRRLTLDWRLPRRKGRHDPQWPWLVEFQMRISESVFARPILPHEVMKARITKSAEGQISVPLPQPVAAFLVREEQGLLLADQPQVVKIDRRWAYLDRGRAYGLRMEDRMIHNMGEDFIKGHVVAFYDQGQKIKSPDGRPIHEGAILYIRTGTEHLKVGQRFGFDSTRFPAAWPPQRTPTQQN